MTKFNYLLHSVVVNGVRRNIESNEKSPYPLVINVSLLNEDGSYVQDIEELYNRKTQTKSYKELLKKFSQPKIINKIKKDGIPIFVLECLPICKILNSDKLKKMEQNGEWMGIEDIEYSIMSLDDWTKSLGFHRYPNNTYNYFKIVETGEKIKFHNLDLIDLYREGGKPKGGEFVEVDVPIPELEVKYDTTGGILKHVPLIGIEESYITLNSDNELVVFLFKGKFYEILKENKKNKHLINVIRKVKNVINIFPSDKILIKKEDRCEFILEKDEDNIIVDRIEYRLLQINLYFLNELKDSLLPEISSFPELYKRLFIMIQNNINTLAFTNT